MKCDYAIVSFQKLKGSLEKKLNPMNESKNHGTEASTTGLVDGDTPKGAKKTKKCEYAVDDNVKYFDRKSGKNLLAVIVKVVSEDVSMIGVQGSRPFYMNNEFLTKY